ncbi:transposase (fragment) [Nitrosomonas mobilis]|uniref:Transposase n=1 Tax=Nitrosomonas mobilis TaxID=51642 RepID=A0A1G5SGX8_9PROT
MNKSTISREFRRNKGLRDWHPKQTQELRDERRKQCANAQRLSLLGWTEVERLVRLDMSLERLVRRLALESVLQISHETIYLRIYADKRRGMIKNRTSIDECPEIVDQKNRIGDWEGDTVIGKNHQGASPC